jgi:hypothetical protein
VSTQASEAPVFWLSGVSGDIVAIIASLPKGKIRQLLSDPTPNESQKELYRDACWLREADLSEAESLIFLQLKFANYYREIQPREFERVIEAAKHAGERKGPTYPPRNDAERAKVLAATPGNVGTLKAVSRVLDAGSLSSEAVIDLLFPKARLLCLAASKERSVTQPRSFFSGSEEQRQFIVPNEMSSELGMNQAGRMTTRSNDNVGPQVYQVIEFDSGTLDEQAKIHLHLKSLGVPLVMVVFSGSKSLHGWYRVNRIGGANLAKFLHYSAALGADRATYVPCQLVRTPNAIRDPGGAKQEVMYLDPEAGK